jgi:protein pelota
MRDGYGEIRLLPESIDDLWHLRHLIAPGDLVFATTLRSTESASDKIRPEKAEKRPVRLGVRVEKAEFSVHGIRLRISGTIEHGVDAGSHHTFNIETGYEISVIRRWRQIDLDRIDRAVNASVYGVIHIMTIEEGEAELFRLRQYGPESVVTVTMGSGKGADLDTRQAFFDTLISHCASLTGPLVIAGPGFIKDDFAKYLKMKNPSLGERVLVAETRRIGRGAVQDVIGLGTIGKLIGDLQLTHEVKLMDEVLRRISINGPVAYGFSAVEKAVGYGAVEHILLTDTHLRNHSVTRLIEKAEGMRSKITVLSGSFEPGERLEALGGIAALLRYSIEG